MTAPTPGPWTAADDGNGRIDYVHADGISIAEDIGGRTVEEVEANARLIAGALELLEAAQLLEAAEDIRENCEECEGEGEPEACGKCFPLFDEARVKRRAAIAKATGAQPSADGQKS